MSLVINSNSSGGEKMVASNMNAGLYINFDKYDFLLIAPQGYRTERGDKSAITVSGDSLNIVKTINGTNINFWSGVVYEALNYPSLGTFAIANSSNGSYLHTYNNIKIASRTPMSGGEVIGRLFCCRPRFVARSTKSGTIQVGLLHSDGTITYCNHSISFDQADGYLYCSEGAGITASQGDYVIVNLSFSIQNGSWSSSSGWSAYSWIEFGGGFNDGDGSPGTRARPIQISIE